MTNDSDTNSGQYKSHVETSAMAVNRTVRKKTVSINRTNVEFEKTDIGDECFRLIKVSQEGELVPVTLSSDSPDSFQIAIGVNKLVFEDRLTFTPTEGGTFVHVRFTPDRTGQHTGRLILDVAEGGQQVVTLAGKARNYIAIPASEQIVGLSSRWKVVATLFLLCSASYAGYTYRCQLIPGLCDQPIEEQRVDVRPTLSASPTQIDASEGVKPETAEPPIEIQKRNVSAPAKKTKTPEVRIAEEQIQPQKERKLEQKPTTTTTRKQNQESKPVQKSSSTSEESELERELNKGSGN